jgi:phenylalanyl-tRNA synthetase beta chain
VLFGEILLDVLNGTARATDAKKYRHIPRFPSTTRDIAMLVPIDLPHGRIAAILSTANEPLLESFALFDVFADPTGAKLPPDKKSLAYSLTYRAPDRTLTADEVNAAHARLKDRLKAEAAVQLRE